VTRPSRIPFRGWGRFGGPALLAITVSAPAASDHLAPRTRDVTGVVFLDLNGNGIRDTGEQGLAGVAVSDQRDVVVSGADGTFRLTMSDSLGLVFVSVPDGYRPALSGAFWRRIDPASAGGSLDFALARAPAPREFAFIHASDTHVSETSLPRLRRLRAMTDSLRPAFVLISGDLVRDALRVGEAEAAGYYEMFRGEVGRFTVPVWTVPGNHENFGIERHLSLVSPAHPLYGKGMYRHYLGPNYYSFTYGGVHFVGLDTVDYDDLWYYGHVDSLQLAWLERDLARVPRSMPVVTFNHIPLVSASEPLSGYRDDPPAPTLITVNGHTLFRHVVSNARDVFTRLRGRPYPLALGGHVHMRERIVYEAQEFPTLFHQAAAVVGPNLPAGLRMISGITLYRVRDGRVDDGTFIPLDPGSPLP
jgi:3',5'-cyclic AMP phosphodiesterase CpdA